MREVVPWSDPIQKAAPQLGVEYMLTPTAGLEQVARAVLEREVKRANRPRSSILREKYNQQK